MDKFGFTRSMSQKGSTPDNAQAESFFGHLKTEFFYNRSTIEVGLESQLMISYKHLMNILGGITPREEKKF